MFRRLLVTLVLMLGIGGARADMPVDKWLAAGVGTTASPKMLWLTPTLKSRVERVLGHAYGGLRVRYWQQGGRTAWVLDEIGKEEPITFGVVVDQGQVQGIEVLAYRESRGWEVRHAFFRKQFEGARLGAEDQLDRRIDGITGATLSVNAMRKVARVALVLANEVRD